MVTNGTEVVSGPFGNGTTRATRLRATVAECTVVAMVHTDMDRFYLVSHRLTRIISTTHGYNWISVATATADRVLSRCDPPVSEYEIMHVVFNARAPLRSHRFVYGPTHHHIRDIQFCLSISEPLFVHLNAHPVPL